MLWLAHLRISHYGMLSCLLQGKFILGQQYRNNVTVCILGHLKIISTASLLGHLK